MDVEIVVFEARASEMSHDCRIYRTTSLNSHINPNAYFVPHSAPIPNLVSVPATQFLTASLSKAEHYCLHYSQGLHNGRIVFLFDPL